MLDVILFNTHDLMLLITAYQCALFSALVFFIRRQSTLSNLLLIGFLLSTAAIPLDTLINYGAGVNAWMRAQHPNWFYVFEVGYWVQGPFLLWYIRSVIYKSFKLDYWDLVYLVPFIFYFLHQVLGYHFLPEEIKTQIQAGLLSNEQNSSIYFITLAREFLRVFFGASCAIELFRFRKQLQHRSNQADAKEFAWLSGFAYAFLFLWSWAFVIAALILLSIKGGISVDVSFMGLSANYVTCFIIGAFIIFVSSRSAVFSSVDRVATAPKPNQKAPVDLNQIKALEALMLSDKPFLEHNLTLDALSEKMGISPRLLSSMINRHYGYNFFEFINHYRITEAKALLLCPEHKSTTVLDIMYASGFNSKATFNNFFKKIEGLTPREFKKQYFEQANQAPKEKPKTEAEVQLEND